MVIMNCEVFKLCEEAGISWKCQNRTSYHSNTNVGCYGNPLDNLSVDNVIKHSNSGLFSGSTFPSKRPGVNIYKLCDILQYIYGMGGYLG